MTDPLIADFYAGDGDINVQAIADAGLPWAGVVLKATQGDYYDGGSWFQRYWPAVRRVGGDRYGVDWLRGAYHYLDFAVSAEKQADAFLRTVDRAGGWGAGDLIAVDVERGGQRAPLTKALVQGVTTRWAQIVHQATGMPIILYGGELIRSLGITDHMGCEAAWVARYSGTLPPATYEGMGWKVEDLWAWQYAGKTTGTHVDAFLPGYATTTPAGLADISVLTMPMERLRERFLVRAVP